MENQKDEKREPWLRRPTDTVAVDLQWPLGLPRWLSGKESPCQGRRHRFDSWVGKIPWKRDRLPTPVFLGFPGGSDGKKFTCNAGNLGLIPGMGRFPGGGHGNPL